MVFVYHHVLFRGYIYQFTLKEARSANKSFSQVFNHAFSGRYNIIFPLCCSIENEKGNCVQCVNDAFFINIPCCYIPSFRVVIAFISELIQELCPLQITSNSPRLSLSYDIKSNDNLAQLVSDKQYNFK